MASGQLSIEHIQDLTIFLIIISSASFKTMPLIAIGTASLGELEDDGDEYEYDPSYAIPTSWLSKLPLPGDYPSAIHNAQQDLCYLIITEFSKADPDVQPAATYISSWAFKSCTEEERLKLGPILQDDDDACILDLFEFTELKLEEALEELREICPEGDEVLLSKLWLHLWIAKEVSLYRDWVGFARSEVVEDYENALVPDDADGFGGKFIDHNGIAFFKPRYPIRFYCQDPKYHSWYTTEPAYLYVNETVPTELVEAIPTPAAESMEPLETSGRETVQETDEGLEIATQGMKTGDQASLVSDDTGISSTDICDEKASPTQGMETGDQAFLVSDDRGIGSTDVSDENASPTQGLETGDQASLVSDDTVLGSTDVSDENASPTQGLDTGDQAFLVSEDRGINSTDVSDENASPTQGLETGDQAFLASEDGGIDSTCDEDASRSIPVSCPPPSNLDAMDIKDTAVVAEIREIWDNAGLRTAPVHEKDEKDWEIV